VDMSPAEGGLNGWTMSIMVWAEDVSVVLSPFEVHLDDLTMNFIKV
jgi:hypothetical protein